MKSLRQIGVTLRALASTYFNLGDYHRALEMLEEARQIREEINDRWGIADIDYMRGDVCHKLGELSAARDSYLKALAQAKELGTKVTILKSLRGLANIAESEGDWEASMTHLKEYTDLREDVYTEEKHKQIAELNVKYETEEKDQRLQQAQKLEAIGTLAGGIAHDFNNILFTMIGYTEMAMDRCHSEGVETSELKEVLTAGKRAKDLVHQILAFSRKTDAKLVPTDIAELLREVCQLISKTFPPNISINIDLQSEQAVINADPSRMHQVLMNLCTNARQAMLKEGGQLSLALMTTTLGAQLAGSLGLADAGDYVVLEVADTGSGIAPEILDRIFDPFFTTRQESDGTGLGLSVVHGLVSELGGTVNVYSEPGLGTTFTVYLPQIRTESNLEQSGTPGCPGGSETVIVIDDEPAIAAMIGRTLSKFGYQTHVFTDACQALVALANAPDQFDLVISDLAMPVMSGETVAQEISQIRKGLPILICTGFDESLTPERTAKLGVSKVLTKPVSREELALAIREAIDN